MYENTRRISNTGTPRFTTISTSFMIRAIRRMNVNSASPAAKGARICKNT